MNALCRRGLLWLIPLVAICVQSSFGKGSSVSYNPVVQVVEGNMPFSSTYTLVVTAPSDLPAGASATVGFVVTPTTIPFGTLADAASYVSFSPQTVTFTAPSQTQSVAVTVAFPLLPLPAGITSATFSYQITTSGWPSTMNPGDGGTSINATASIAPVSGGTPPVVTITTPADGAVLPYSSNAFPAQIPFQFQATSTTGITAVDAALGGTPITLTSVTGLGTGSVTGTGMLTLTGAGLYAVQARATNAAGTGSDTNNFTVSVAAPPPTVTITTPANGSSFTYRYGNPALVIPVSFTAQSPSGSISTLTATVDGAAATFVPTGIGTATAAGTINLNYTTGGTHTVVVTTTDANGTGTAQTTFTVNAVASTPSVVITSPANNATFATAVGATTTSVPFTFTSASTNGFFVDSVALTLDGVPVAGVSTTGLGTAAATSSGTLLAVGGGQHTLVASATSAGLTATSTVQFTVTVTSAQPPPSVVINSPAAGATYTRYATGPALSIPLSFTGTSNATTGVITKLTATLDGTPLSVSAALNQKSVTGTAVMSVTTAGTHTISVAAFDAYGTATATRTFTVTVLPGYAVRGTIFFDVDGDGVLDAQEFGIAGMPVTLRSTFGQLIGTTVSAADGTYSFTQVPAGNYFVMAGPSTGLVSTRGAVRMIAVTTSDVTADIGFMLNFCAIDSMCATGNSVGYWKNNLDKAIAGKSAGVQVSAATMLSYTKAIGSLALAPYDAITEKSASAVMGSTSSSAPDLLSKQLIAAEYNYENKAYLNGNANLTFLFIWWGEYVLTHPSSYSTTYILYAKDWFDAYNNSHGGQVDGPSSSTSSCSTSSPCGYSYGYSDDSWYSGCR